MAAVLAKVLAASLVVAVSVQAQVPPDQSIGGQVATSLSYGSTAGWCYVRQGASQLQLNAMNGTGVISFPEVIFFDGGTYYPLDGQARLTFTSATSGTIKFKFWGAGSVPNSSFNNYTETFNGQQYLIKFNILFPGCTLPISAGYEAP